MFESLSERLERSFKILKGQGKITEINVAETLKDVRKALLDADVNYKTAKVFTETVKEKALGQDVLNSLKPSQLMVKIVHDELTALMGGQDISVDITGTDYNTLTLIAAVAALLAFGRLNGVKEGTLVAALAVGPLVNVYTRCLGPSLRRWLDAPAV